MNNDVISEEMTQSAIIAYNHQFQMQEVEFHHASNETEGKKLDIFLLSISTLKNSSYVNYFIK